MSLFSRTSFALLSISVVALLGSGCGEEYHEPWREQKLSSGKTIKVSSVQIAWGVEHDEPRHEDRDCFVLQYVFSAPDADDASHEKEAWEVFELIRPVSEQWGLKYAELMAYSTTDHGRHYDLFFFEKGANGKWTEKLTHF